MAALCGGGKDEQVAEHRGALLGWDFSGSEVKAARRRDG